jgi:hypothetical protein
MAYTKDKFRETLASIGTSEVVPDDALERLEARSCEISTEFEGCGETILMGAHMSALDVLMYPGDEYRAFLALMEGVEAWRQECQFKRMMGQVTCENITDEEFIFGEMLVTSYAGFMVLSDENKKRLTDESAIDKYLKEIRDGIVLWREAFEEQTRIVAEQMVSDVEASLKN